MRREGLHRGQRRQGGLHGVRTSTPPILDSEPLSDEDKRLLATLDDIEAKQPELLDQAGKRVIELATGLQAVFLAIAAFGDKFPPAYVKGNPLVQALVIAVLALYWLAILSAAWAMQPRRYKRYEYNLTRMRGEFDKIIAHKSRWVTVAGVFFVLASLALVALIVTIVRSAA